MAEVDTSSYPRQAAPKSFIDQVQGLNNLDLQQQALQSGALGIDKQKLDLVNQRFGEVAKGFFDLIKKPDLNEDDIRQHFIGNVKNGFMPAEQAAAYTNQLPPNATSNQLRDILKRDVSHAQTIVEHMNQTFGTNATVNDTSGTSVGIQKPAIEGGGFAEKNFVPTQLPPTQEVLSNQPTLANGQPNPNYLQRGVIGAPPGGVYPARRPTALRNAVASPTDVQAPVNDPSQGNLTGPRYAPPSGPTGPTVNRGTEFNNRFSAAFPNAVPTGAAPGQISAKEAVGAQSGKDFASDLTRAKTLQADLQPDLAVLNIVKGKGPTDFGPGTDTLNQLKKIAATWLPNVSPQVIQDASDYDTVKKYLVQGARSAGNTGTNDQLAAAFEANPNTTMNTATIENIVKSRVALRKMQAAQTLLFSRTGLPEDNYSKWIATNQNVLDPRAFGFDIMDDKAKTKLVEQLKKDPKAYKKFENSLQFAHDAELIEPPAR